MKWLHAKGGDGRWRLFHRFNPFQDEEERKQIGDAIWRRREWLKMVNCAHNPASHRRAVMRGAMRGVQRRKIDLPSPFPIRREDDD